MMLQKLVQHYCGKEGTGHLYKTGGLFWIGIGQGLILVKGQIRYWYYCHFQFNLCTINQLHLFIT